MKTRHQLQLQGRRLDKLNDRVRAAHRAMRDGESLHLERHSGTDHWWLTRSGQVDCAVARALTAKPDVAAVGDALFLGVASQTWRYVDTD